VFADAAVSGDPRSLYVMAPDGTDLTQLTDDADFSYGNPVWEPGATRFAAKRIGWTTGEVSVVIFDVAEGVNGLEIIAEEDVTDIAGGPLQPVSGARWGRIAWANTQDKLAVSFQDDIWVIDLANPAGAVNITDRADDQKHPSWSPDDLQIVFENRNGKNSKRKTIGDDGIVVMDADGSNRVVIHTEDRTTAVKPAWK